MPCFMGGLILKHTLCMWALICPSATLSHILFLLKGSETPVSDFSRVLSFLCISLQTPLKSSPTLPNLILENLQGVVIRQRAFCHPHWLVPLPMKLQGQREEGARACAPSTQGLTEFGQWRDSDIQGPPASSLHPCRRHREGGALLQGREAAQITPSCVWQER